MALHLDKVKRKSVKIGQEVLQLKGGDIHSLVFLYACFLCLRKESCGESQCFEKVCVGQGMLLVQLPQHYSEKQYIQRTFIKKKKQPCNGFPQYIHASCEMYQPTIK